MLNVKRVALHVVIKKECNYCELAFARNKPDVTNSYWRRRRIMRKISHLYAYESSSKSISWFGALTSFLCK